MAHAFQHMMMRALILTSCLASWALTAFAADAGIVARRAEPTIEPRQSRDHSGLTTSQNKPATHDPDHADYSPDRYIIGTGQGDLTKGVIVCHRVSELSARTDLAKQIRVLVKEHMIDRIRERSGGNTDQDIELTREEIVQEYLQGVKIVDRQIDVERNICSATAIMPKRQILQPGPLIERQESTPVITR